MQGSKPTTPKNTQRPFNVKILLKRPIELEGDIIEFNENLIAIRHRRAGSHKFDVSAFGLNDPRIRLIIGDPRGGPGKIIIQDDNRTFESLGGKTPLVGTLSSGPHGFVKVNRLNEPPAWVPAAYMSVRDPEDVIPTGIVKHRGKQPGVGKAAPTPFGKGPPNLQIVGGKGKGRPGKPPTGTPAATPSAQDSEWG